jgi:hypothetical protein
VIESKAAGAPTSALLPLRDQVQTRTGNAEDELTISGINQSYDMVLWHRWCEQRQPGSTRRMGMEPFLLTIDASSTRTHDSHTNPCTPSTTHTQDETCNLRCDEVPCLLFTECYFIFSFELVRDRQKISIYSLDNSPRSKERRTHRF